jgi:branched-chain amino acid transport system ATP-binding protein
MGTGGLVVEGVTVAFGGLTALEAVSLSAHVGEVVGVIGPNGAGKTTLFNVMCGFVAPQSGSITVEGKRLNRIHPHDLARHGIARTLQGVGLWPGLTVLENVMAGAEVRSRARVGAALGGLPRSSRDENSLADQAMAALTQLGVAEFSDRLPPSLPYATQKRVSLARALVTSPTFLLLDEPASGLSESEMADLASRLHGLKATMGVLLVEHHMDLVMAVCDRIVVLNFGRVIASGTPVEVATNAEVTAAYLGTHLSEEKDEGSGVVPEEVVPEGVVVPADGEGA